MKRFPFLLLLGIILVVFHQWFSFQVISGGDYPFLFRENLDERLSFPLTWKEGYNAPLLNFYLPILFTGFLSKLGLDFVLIERLVWFWPFLILTIFSSWYLAKAFFPKNVFCLFSSLVFLFNPYILMVIGGGQVGVAMAYALAPLVLGVFIKSIQTSSLKLQTITGLILAFQVMFDPRISFITMAAVFLYAVFQYGLSVRRYIRIFVLPFFIALGIHFYWLLPTILARRMALPPGYNEPGWVEFLSFADFSNSLSLLHPNWPENIFGKTYFMRPEFLLLPILAYISLLFINELKSSRAKKNISFFAFLGLMGAFLAKGSKPPFGEVYLWLFKYFPGMNMFRDPTKFYLFPALSYSMLIPITISEVYNRLKKSPSSRVWRVKLPSFSAKLFVAVIFIFWLFLIREAVLGQLGGTFKARRVPTEYIVLKDFIHSQEGFFRTLWIPKKQRFGFSSNNHPAIESPELLSEEELAFRGVRYVIIPFDSEGEIFLKDRKYDHQQRLALEKKLDEIPWLRKINLSCFNDLNHCNKIAIYQTPSYKDRFFIDLLTSSKVNELISWRMVNPTKYIVSVKINQPPATLVFSETYDELWQAKIGKKIIPSTRYNDLNSFVIDQTGDFEIVVEFEAQKYVTFGLFVSIATFLATIGVLVYSWRKG